MSIATNQERRKLRRLPAAVLSVELQGKKGLFKKWLPTNVIDFNHDGIALAADPEFAIGDSMVLKVDLKMDMGNITVEKVDAVVRNRTSAGSVWRYGLEFDLSSFSGDKSIEVSEQLKRINRILEKNEALKERMKSIQ